MKHKLGKMQKALIKKHNAQMKIISHTAKVTGMSEAVLFYAAAFGIIGMPWAAPPPSTSNRKRL